MAHALHLAFKGNGHYVPACSVTRPHLPTTPDETKVTCMSCKAYIRRRGGLGGVPDAGVSKERRIQNQLSSARQRLRMAWERLLNAHRAGHESESVARDLAQGDVVSICGIQPEQKDR